jgi:NAD(P)-dependent dehydrogenase (short-subunit alcohol dehydrogenase family)
VSARSSSFPETALVTGGASGIGAAIVAALEADGVDVVVLDLADGFDVGDPHDWEAVTPADLVCLNAGVLTGEGDIRLLGDEEYRRALRTNVDGVVFGVRQLAPLMRRGSAFVVTASLAGLTPMPSDPVYTLTKHAVVGFVRAVAPQLELRGIRINLVCPGIADTPMLDKGGQRAAFEASGFPLLQPEEVAAAVLLAARSEETGRAWAVQPGREPLEFRFPGVPGPRAEGGEGVLPPL